MKIANLSQGHGIINYEIFYRNYDRKDIMVQYEASYYSCLKKIKIDRYEFRYIARSGRTKYEILDGVY